MGFLTKLPHLNVSVTKLVSKEKLTVGDASVEPPLAESEPTHIHLPLASTSTSTEPLVTVEEEEAPKSPTRPRKISFYGLSFIPHRHHHDHTPHKVLKHKSSHPLLQAKVKGKATTSVQKNRVTKPVISRSEKRAKASALALRSLIIGDLSQIKPQASPKAIQDAKHKLAKAKADLVNPSKANKVIAQLRALPPTEDEDSASSGDEDGEDLKKTGAKPIHAVCLEHPDEEEACLKFQSKSSKNPLASAEELDGLLEGLKLIDLIKSPELGIGQGANGNGLLSGAVPTPGTVINGFKRITPELMAIGYATGKAIYPDHTGVYPPTDRMSILTYWWGLEICLPPPSMAYLTKTHSISSSVMNFLSAVALVNQGVREILPFIRYISQYMDFEFNALKAQDKGQGVVCAATWIMPAALVPRPWDFPPRPPEKTKAPEKKVDEHKAPPVMPLPPSPPLSIGFPTNPRALPPVIPVS